MNYYQWSEKLYGNFFNTENTNQEVILFTDENLINELHQSNQGVENFLNIFKPKLILSNCNPQPNNRLSIRNRIHQRDEFKSLEYILEYFVDNPGATIVINKNRLSCSDTLSYFPFIILVVYAYSSAGGVFNSQYEKEMLGNEMKVREFTYILSKRLAEKIRNKFIINVYNIYCVNVGPYRYVGFFKYHSLFNPTEFITIKEIIRRQNIHRPIYNDCEILIRFSKIGKISIKTIGPAKLLINKIIEGTIVINERIENEIGAKAKNEIILYPQIELDLNDNIKNRYLKPKIDTQLTVPDSIFLIFGNTEIELNRHQGDWYRLLPVTTFDNSLILNKGYDILNITNPNAIFFQQMGVVFEEFPSDSNFYIYTEKPLVGNKTIFIGSESLRKKVIDVDKENEWIVRKDLLICYDLKKELVFDGKGFKSIVSINNEIKLEFFGGYKIQSTGHDKIYPYLLLPKLNYDLFGEYNLKLKYQCEENSGIVEYNIKNDEDIIFRNSNPHWGQYGLNLNSFFHLKKSNGENIIRIFVELVDKDGCVIKINSLTLVPEFIQPILEIMNRDQPIQIKHIDTSRKDSSVEQFRKACEDDYLTRIIATANYNNNIELNNKNLDEIIVKAKLYKNIFINENEESDIQHNIIRELRALGYLKIKQNNTNNNPNNYSYEPAELALIQVNSSPQGFHEGGFTFFLSGLRSFDFIKAILQTIKDDVENFNLKISIKDSKENKLDKLLPPEIYFSYRNITHLNNFLNSEIEYSDEKTLIRNYLKIVPYNGDALNNLTSLNFQSIESFLFSNTLSNSVLDIDMDVSILIDGKIDKFSLLKAKNTNNLFIGKGLKRGNFKQINPNMGFIIAYSDNNLPYIFSQHMGNKGGFLPIFLNTSVKLPQDIYSNLVYLNGGLPSICSIETKEDTKYYNTPNTFENVEIEFPNNETEFYKFDIDLAQRCKLEEILKTEIIYIQNAKIV